MGSISKYTGLAALVLGLSSVTGAAYSNISDINNGIYKTRKIFY